MRSIGFVAIAVALAGCAASSASFIESKKGFEVSQGFVIKLADLHSPKITKLKDGVAYEVTAPGCTVVLEGPRGDREHFELRVGDYFVKGSPHSYVLLKYRVPSE
ncbi:MAG: hypothetical protein ACYTGV_10370 [Planctomycetota bacterium]|jgi:hypothetical protein